MVLLAGCIIICAAHCTYPLSWIKRSIDKMPSISCAAMLTKQINSCNFAFADYPPSGYLRKHFANLLNGKLLLTSKWKLYSRRQSGWWNELCVRESVVWARLMLERVCISCSINEVIFNTIPNINTIPLSIHKQQQQTHARTHARTHQFSVACSIALARIISLILDIIWCVYLGECNRLWTQ